MESVVFACERGSGGDAPCITEPSACWIGRSQEFCIFTLGALTLRNVKWSRRGEERQVAIMGDASPCQLVPSSQVLFLCHGNRNRLSMSYDIHISEWSTSRRIYLYVQLQGNNE